MQKPTKEGDFFCFVLCCFGAAIWVIAIPLVINNMILLSGFIVAEAIWLFCIIEFARHYLEKETPNEFNH